MLNYVKQFTFSLCKLYEMQFVCCIMQVQYKKLIQKKCIAETINI